MKSGRFANRPYGGRRSASPLEFGSFCKREVFSLKAELSENSHRKGLPMPTIPQNQELLKHLFALIAAHRVIFKQERIYQRVCALVLAEMFVFARHTISQLLMALGQTEQDWSAWYRLFSAHRFDYDQASEILFRQTLAHVGEDEVYVVAGD